MIRRAGLACLPVLLCAAVGTHIPAAAQETARVICADPAGGAPATRLTVPLLVLEGDGVAAFQVDVHYDPALLAYTGSRLGPDPIAAGGWIYDSQTLAAGTVRVLAYSFPPAGLGPGPKRLALLDFDVVAPEPLPVAPLRLSGCVLGDVNATSIPCAPCMQPGAGAAAPRFAFSEVDDGFAFRPARLVIETGDWVLWRNAGASRTHTTTSGVACVADGGWRGLLPPDVLFERRFPEPGGSVRPYFSEPECGLGMTGQVEVTAAIRLLLTPDAAGTRLQWTGGGGRYRVHRSPAPSFATPGTTSFAPDAGEEGTAVTDPVLPPPGQALFYLVTNAY